MDSWPMCLVVLRCAAEAADQTCESGIQRQMPNPDPDPKADGLGRFPSPRILVLRQLGMSKDR